MNQESGMSRSMDRRDQLLGPWAAFGLASATLFAGSLLAIQSSWLSGGILVIWPADGLIVGLMLAPQIKRPWLVMVGGLLGAALAFAVVNRQTVLGGTRIGLMMAAIPCTYWALGRLLRGRSIAEPRVLLPFMAICAVIGTPTSILRAYLIHKIWGFPFAEFALTTAIATFVGYAVITPLILLIARPREEPSRPWRANLMMWCVVALYTIVMAAAFRATHYPTAFVIPLGLILVAHAVDFSGIIVVILATAVISVWMTFTGYGPISHFQGDLKIKILMTQAFLSIIIVMTLPFSALMNEREKLRRSLVAALGQANAASQAKSVFLANISHEIRTPLNGVLGMAQVIAMGELNPAQRERVEVVRRSGESLLSLLNDVLDLSKIEAGELTLESIDFDPVTLVRAVVAQNQALATDKGLAIKVDWQRVDGLYQGDPNRIRQIVQNLISNAIKFTESGSVAITVKARADDEGLIIEVRDTGIGVPEDKINALFQKFRQVDESTTRRFGGTGLGLSICRQLAQAMGGDVLVKSRQGSGSIFEVVLPLRRSVGLPAQGEASAVPYRPPELVLRALAAQDNPTHQLVAR
jgi:signal transduction histidine kinase